MGDPHRVGMYSRFLTRVVYCVVLLTFSPLAAATQAQRVALTARAVSTSQINLSWTNDSNKVTDLYVERSLSPKGPWRRVINVPANAASCANSGLTAGTTYYYRVMKNQSLYSTVASATTLSSVTDRFPGNLSATATSSNQIDLSWSDDIADITGFKIERCAGKGCSNFIEIANVAANVTSYQNTDLTALTSYSYRVRAHKQSSYYAYSKIASATTSRNTVPPMVPKGLVANVVSSSQINLNWNSEAVDYGAAGFNVYQYGERIGSTAGTSFTVKRLAPNTQYCFSVQSFDKAGNSSFQSDVACATTKPDSQPESNPTPE